MYTRTILFYWLSCSFVTASAAQESSGRIDLDLLSGGPRSQLVVVRIEFAGTGNSCPQQFGALRAYRDGSMAELQALFSGSPNRYSEARTAALDDETYRHHVGAEACRVDMDIREQVRHDGIWTSLLLPRTLRPSLSPEERSEALRELYDRPSRIPPEQFGRYVDARDARRSMGSLLQGGVITLSGGLDFEGVRSCFDVVGDYLIDQRGVAFQFVTNLSTDMNRFVMERIDVDDDHSRLYLTRGDCRIELTVGASILLQGQWVTRSIAPFHPPVITIKRGG